MDTNDAFSKVKVDAAGKYAAPRSWTEYEALRLQLAEYRDTAERGESEEATKLARATLHNFAVEFNENGLLEYLVKLLNENREQQQECS